MLIMKRLDIFRKKLLTLLRKIEFIILKHLHYGQELNIITMEIIKLKALKIF